MSDDEAAPPGGFTPRSDCLSARSVTRIRSAFKASARPTDDGSSVSQWVAITEKSRAFREALLSDGDIGTYLDNPAGNDLCYGFDNLFDAFTRQIKGSHDFQTVLAASLYRELVTLAEAIGVQRVWNPEFPIDRKPVVPPPEDLLQAIDARLGITLHFPNPFPDEFGVVTSRGIASQRAIHAVYQAWRLKSLAAIHGGRILEIGAGFGRTAYYMHRLGCESYTIVDLPETNISQANFLLRTLNSNDVCLAGESHTAQIRIVPQPWLEEHRDRFDVVLNVDSLTEMDRRVALNYAAFAMQRANIFVSINHESNPFTVDGLEPLQRHLIGRFPYALRTGYFEELYLSHRRSRETPASTRWRVTSPLDRIKRRLLGVVGAPKHLAACHAPVQGR